MKHSVKPYEPSKKQTLQVDERWAPPSVRTGMTPLERAARALYLLRDGPSEAMQAHLSADELAEEQAYADAEWRRYLPEVRAVLAAVRDPSEAMIGACDSIGLDEIKEDPRRGALFWQAMVDAGLAEEPT